ncbi:hypothetical protein MQE36_00775 [Zhouia spongiae]|uniref:DUF3052 family protein n=1 Tax=Zhouia spongiae TaxID=2202721 RepID=A0ABY3YMW9_9FLAO|nr:hypothetical protein [Zhouia spongiae]UNY98904.1 hypothetical protein MQE36_00775 [Zhouia spongiae]
MKSIIKKLGIKGKSEILLLNVPDEFDRDFHTLEDIEVFESLIQITQIDYALYFAHDINEIERQFDTLRIKLKEDATLWIAFPKNSAEITKEYNWKPLNNNCFISVENLSINENWKAKRFRKLEYTKCKEIKNS